MRVLIVDDERDLTELCRIGLESNGHTVQIALDGESGLEMIFGSTPPDVIVLDFMMPGVDGLSVLERMQRVPEAQREPVVKLSAKGRAEDAARGLAAGATAYVTKPFSLEDLEQLLEDVASEDAAARAFRRNRALAGLQHRTRADA